MTLSHRPGGWTLTQQWPSRGTRATSRSSPASAPGPLRPETAPVVGSQKPGLNEAVEMAGGGAAEDAGGDGCLAAADRRPRLDYDPVDLSSAQS